MRTAVWLCALLIGGRAAAGDADDDAAALALPPPVATRAVAGPASLTAEVAATQADQQTGPAVDAQRLSLDLHYDSRWAPAWRVLVDDRLDLDRVDAPRDTESVNVLKQAYVSWQPRTDLLIDAGRVNARQGVAFGYNPTDLFRADALRTVESLDPDSLRDNRLGSVMLRGQRLWDEGSMSASFSPRLAAAPSTGPFAADWGATNALDRWQVTLTQRLSPGWSPQWLVSGAAGQAPQFGLNLTAALGGSAVAFLETSTGRSKSTWAEAADLPGTEAWRTRAAAGVTYSTSNKLSLTLEYEYDGAAPGRGAWSALRQGDPQRYGLYRGFASAQQDLATRGNLFAYASWQDAGVRHLDVSGFIRVDALDRSRLPWVEARYHWNRIDAALRWQDAFGGATSDYGALTGRRTWQLVLDYYL